MDFLLELPNLICVIGNELAESTVVTEAEFIIPGFYNNPFSSSWPASLQIEIIQYLSRYSPILPEHFYMSSNPGRFIIFLSFFNWSEFKVLGLNFLNFSKKSESLILIFAWRQLVSSSSNIINASEISRTIGFG